jgi:DNA-binding CsgD family transcriptional regulator
MSRMMTTFAIVDGLEVRVRSGTMGGNEWCTIGQVGFGFDGRCLRVALLLMHTETPARANRVKRSVYWGTGGSADDRQRTVLALRESGVSTSEIARKLGIQREMARGILRRHDQRVRSTTRKNAGSETDRGEP